jgi:hypothetical protein
MQARICPEIGVKYSDGEGDCLKREELGKLGLLGEGGYAGTKMQPERSEFQI